MIACKALMTAVVIGWGAPVVTSLLTAGLALFLQHFAHV